LKREIKPVGSLAGELRLRVAKSPMISVLFALPPFPLFKFISDTRIGFL